MHFSNMLPPVIYSASGDCTGWGNKLRGLYFAILVAKLLDRPCWVDYSLLELAFDYDRRKLIDPRNVKDHISILKKSVTLRPVNSQNDRIQLHNLIARKDDHTPIMLCEGNQLSSLLANNEEISKILAIKLSGSSAYFWPHSILSSIRLKPSIRLTPYIQQIKNMSLGYNFCKNPPYGFIQFRSFVDAVSSNLNILSDFISESIMVLNHLRLALCFISTDNYNISRLISKKLGEKGIDSIVCDSNYFIHTGGANEISLREMNKELPSSPPKSLTQDSQTTLENYYPVLATWEVMRESSAILSTFTSFAISAFCSITKQPPSFRFCRDAKKFYPYFGVELDW